MMQGLDIRYVVTNIGGGGSGGEGLYDALYCACGHAENLIKLRKIQLATGRTKCRSTVARQVRLVLHNGAYWLILKVRGAAALGAAWQSRVRRLVDVPDQDRHPHRQYRKSAAYRLRCYAARGGNYLPVWHIVSNRPDHDSRGMRPATAYAYRICSGTATERGIGEARKCSSRRSDFRRIPQGD
jgi:Transposase DDE domain group 1